MLDRAKQLSRDGARSPAPASRIAEQAPIYHRCMMNIRSLMTCAAVSACLVAGVSADDKSELTAEVQEGRAEFVKKDASIGEEIAKAAGYALFPGVGKGAIGVGGARGTGQVVVNGSPIAKTTLTQVTIGLQLGGQKYRELILFQDKASLDKFMQGKFTMAAQASAVAAASGAAANARYSNGVKVITMAVGGLMYEASVGGQKFGIEKY
jgi:lipid-binding SYLF domain-containing protein